MSTALIGVDPSDAGVASAMVNTTQQTGASLGVSLLNTVAATATANFLLHHGMSPITRAEALVHGYTISFTISAVLLATAAVTTLPILRAKRERRRPPWRCSVPMQPELRASGGLSYRSPGFSAFSPGRVRRPTCNAEEPCQPPG